MILLWSAFLVFVLILLALDLGVFNRKAHAITARSAMRWVALFVSLGAIFNVAVFFIYANDAMGIGTEFAKLMMGADEPDAVMPSFQQIGWTAAMQFLAGWLTEYSLSVDNLFVIALVFSYFKVPAKYQHRVLFWGILGALIARGVMILLGTALVQQFEWILYLLGAFLIYTGFKMARSQEPDFDPDKSRLLRLARKVFPVSSTFDGERFFTRLTDGTRAITPLFLVLLVVEATDVAFAVDSIPAIIGITRDPFLVFTSNVFAILGLRSLYFALAALMDKFHYLRYSLAFVLVFVGVKMLLEGVGVLGTLAARLPDGLARRLTWLPTESVHIPTAASLGIIVAALTVGVVASLLYAKRHPGEPGRAGPDPKAGGRP